MVCNATLLRASAWSALRSWGTKLTTVIIFILLARILSPSEIGAISILAAIILLIQTAVEAVFSEYIVKSPDLGADEVNSIFWSQAVLGFVAALVIGFSAMFWAPFVVQSPDATLMVQALAITIAISSIGRVPDALMRARLQFRKIALRSIATTVAGGAVGLWLAFAGYGLWSLVAKQVVESVTECLMNYAASGWRPGRPSLSTNAPALSYGLPLAGSYALTILSGRIDFFVIGLALGPHALGLYAFALRIYQVVYELFVGVLTQISLPILAQVRNDPQALSLLHIKLVRIVSLLSSPTFCLLALSAAGAIPLLVGDAWRASIPVLQLMCIAGPVAAVTTFNASVLLAAGRSGTHLQFTGLGLAFGVLAFTAAAPFGLLALALAFVARYFLLAVFSSYAAASAGGTSGGNMLQAGGPPFLLALGGAALGFWVQQIWPMNDPVSAGMTSVAAALAVMGGLGFALYRKDLFTMVAAIRRKSVRGF
ncbi:MAG TPA: oligosaccharide flippase family protein [Allosphingosinicella sp.]|nr:oligosaccharide flippase family protein [Allosphingosinicella sp.]